MKVKGIRLKESPLNVRTMGTKNRRNTRKGDKENRWDTGTDGTRERTSRQMVNE